MMWLLSAPFLAGGGVFVSYKRSPAARARKRAATAVSSLERTRTEALDFKHGVSSRLEVSARAYKEQIQQSRLTALSIDELKSHGAGMRLQALRDSGICNMASMEGRDGYRLSQLRGVGEKSAVPMARAAAKIITSSRAKAIPWPAVPFEDAQAQALTRELYRSLWFDRHFAPLMERFEDVTVKAAEASLKITSGTSFSRWLWRLGAGEACSEAMRSAEDLCARLEPAGEYARVQHEFSSVMYEWQNINSNPLDRETLCRDFAAFTSDYEHGFERLLGKDGRLSQASVSKAVSLGEKVATPVATDEILGDAPTLPGGSAEQFGSKPASDGQRKLLEQLGGGADTLEGVSRIEAQKRIGELVMQRKSEPKPLDDLHAVIVPGVEDTITYKIPPPPSDDLKSSGRGPGQWFAPNESVSVQGVALTHGFIYGGQAGSSGKDPAVIDATLPVSFGGSVASVEGWESYAGMSPTSRGRYLSWLAQGGIAKSHVLFGKLYFFALERRLLELAAARSYLEDHENFQLIVVELERVVEVFREETWDSVPYRCRRLLSYATQLQLIGKRVETPPEKPLTAEYPLPFALRYGLGCLLKDRQPITAEWALAWAQANPEVSFRTPATRCPEEFAKAFRKVMRGRFPDGWIVQANKTQLKVEYHPQSWILKGLGTNVTLNVPDVCALTAPQQILREMVEESTSLLDGYSRFLGRHVEKEGSLEACLQLPLDLWPETAVRRFLEVRHRYAIPMHPLSYAELITELGSADGEAATRILEFVRGLESAGVGMEPYVLAGARKPKPTDKIVLFVLTGEVDVERKSEVFQMASLAMTLAACLAQADGDASDDELAAADSLAQRWEGLSADQSTRLRAQYRLQVGEKILLSSLRSRLLGLPQEGRKLLAQRLPPLASADGHVSPGEVRMLEQLYKVLGLEAGSLYGHLYSGSGPKSGSHPLSHSESFVDMARLEELRRETAQVDQLLASVFTAEEEVTDPPMAVPRSPEASSRTNVSLQGLDRIHSEFLEILLSKPEWTRLELKEESSRRKLMLDGALERINDASFDAFGEALLERQMLQPTQRGPVLHLTAFEYDAPRDKVLPRM